MLLSDLRAEVHRVMNRTDILDTHVDDAANRAVRRMNRDLRVPGMQKQISITVPGADGIATLPADFLEFIHVADAGGDEMTRATVRVFNETRSPFHGIYTSLGKVLRLKPFPVAGSKVALTYYAKVPTFTPGDGGASNLYSDDYYDVLLAGTLAHVAASFLDTREADFDQRFLTYLVEAQEAGDREEFSGRGWVQKPYVPEGAW